MLMTEEREADHRIYSTQLTLKHGARSLAQPELRDGDRLTVTNMGMYKHDKQKIVIRPAHPLEAEKV